MLDPELEAIQWPADFSGQQLFIQGEDWQYNAMLNWSHCKRTGITGCVTAASYAATTRRSHWRAGSAAASAHP